MSIDEFNQYFGIGEQEPEPEPGPEPEGTIFRMRVVQEGLKIRMGPSTSSEIIGSLHAGDLVEVLDVGGSSAWVEIEADEQHPGGWANVQYGQDRNMEPVK